jgi:hypothetical protein
MEGCLLSIGLVKKEKRENEATAVTGGHTGCEGMNG